MYLQTFSSTQYFNSHAHVERDRVNLIISKRQINFNSHAHVERDNGLTRAWLMNIISTHTLTWSVTFERIEAM